MIPNIVGVDIGCGMRVVPFTSAGEIDYHSFNQHILQNIPSRRNVREGKVILDSKRLNRSIGTLGGGNHFIELDRDENGLYYLVVHTGSRDLGRQVAQIDQKTAVKNQSGWDELMAEQKRMIEEYKAAGRRSELQEAIRQLHNSFKMRRPSVPDDLCWLTGESREDYLHDMRICQRWAVLNREIITAILIDFLTASGHVVETGDFFESVHNYISDDNMVRKGAISAEAGEKCIIPLNMRDGSLICEGKGNSDWNCSAPHGAGRIMSRAQAFRQLSLDDFRSSMEGIYSETVDESTIDEAPMVYKPKDEIIANIADTVRIINIIKPVYNYKAAE